jgi:cell division protease FtsH
VHKISIIPRGLAALGYTQQRPTEDRYLMSSEERLAKIDVLLGGRIAEKITFGDVTTGAGNDLMRATDIARAMVAEYGMGETLALSTYPRQRMPAFLETSQAFAGGREYSDATAAQLDQEVKSILNQREEHVTRLLTEHNPMLITVAEKLLEKEVLMEEEFKAIMEASGGQA